VQATMGAIFRVSVMYVDLPKFLQNKSNIPIYVADLDGENVYSSALSSNAILVMGNEGNGISDEVLSCATQKIHIPSFNESGKTSESLNVAVATAILCSEFKRRQL
jgi:TrmH family RNA methyltransferase